MPLGRRVAVSIGLSAFFLIVYGSCAAVTAWRTDVPAFHFGWERGIPFVPWLIVPYLSIDLFFVAAPLLLADRAAVRTFAVRVLAAITVAALVFLVAPLRFSFVRPEVSGLIGQFFTLFQQLDKPFNQLPSLHVALALIVGDVFVRRFGGPARIALYFWFGLIAVSPVFVFQHHLIDLVAGLALGLICLTFVPNGLRPVAFERSPRIGGYYLAAALILIGLSIWLGRRAWPLWWPALSFALVAIAYFVVGPSAYAKRDGRLPWSTRLLLWPTLLGQTASRAWYARQANPYDVVTDRLWIGRHLSNREAAAARAAGVGAVVDLTCEFSAPKAFRGLPYLHVPTLDLTAPTPAHIADAVAFIRQHEAASIVYVHCKAGYSRTAVIAAAYLLTTGRAASDEQAIVALRRARPSIVIRPEALRAIRRVRPAGVATR